MVKRSLTAGRGMLEEEGREGLTELLQQRLPEATQFLTLVSPAIRVWEQWLVLKMEWKHSLASSHASLGLLGSVP